MEILKLEKKVEITLKLEHKQNHQPNAGTERKDLWSVKK